jgi:hypothetical protein
MTCALALSLILLLLPAVALGYKVKTTEANLDWDPREDLENATETTPIRWFDPKVYYRISGNSIEGLSQSDFADLVQQAAQIWTDTLRSAEAVEQEKACFPQLTHDGPSENTTGIYADALDGENTVYFILDPDQWTDERGYDSKSLAMTKIRNNPTTGQILEADIEINAAAFNFKSPPESVEAETRRLGYTIEHEFGHLVGMGHSEVETALMYATTTDDIVAFPLVLDNDDVEGACYLYQDVEVHIITPASPATEGGCNSASGTSPLINPLLALLLSLCVLVGRRRERV